MSKKKESLDKREIRRRLALLTLAGEQQEDAPGDCPDLETFAAFLEGHLAAPENQTLLEHISRCESCYQRWLELSCERGRAGQDTSGVGSVLKRRRWLSGVGSIGAIALGIMIFLSLDYRLNDQRPVGKDGPETAPQSLSPSARMKADEDHGADEEQEAVNRTESMAKKVYSARQPLQQAGSAESAGDAERLENQKGEGAGSESLQEVRLPAPVDADQVQPAEKRSLSPLAMPDQLSGPAADSNDFINLVSELCENDSEAEVSSDKSWKQKLQMLQDQGRALLESATVQMQERLQVELILEIVEGETASASGDREQLCRRLASHLGSVQSEQ